MVQDNHPLIDPPARELHSTRVLLGRARAGERGAQDALAHRFLVPLQRWAHGRLPRRGRDLLDTDDIVQVALARSLERVETFEPERPGAFLAYLRRAVINRLRDEVRRVARHARPGALEEEVPSLGPSPVEEALGAEAQERYEAALAALDENQAAAAILRIELGFSYSEIAAALGSPSADAARMTVVRALVKLAEKMRDGTR